MLKNSPNNDIVLFKSKYYKYNQFVKDKPISLTLPKYEEIKDRLPKPIFDGHDDYLECYDFAWKTAFSNLRNPFPNSGFVSDFIDTAFNGCLFMWDSSFILMFTKYANHIFPFQKTLDNFYALQHKDGFICREIIEETGWDHFTKNDVDSTGPNIMAWCEWKYFETFNDIERLRKVYYPLRAFHVWFRKNRTWKDGSYFSSGWGCGMDNIPRLEEKYDHEHSNGKMIWCDICFQSILNCDILIRMNEALGNIDDTSDLVEERNRLKKLVNEKLWDENTKFYYDLWNNKEKNYVKHIGAYWSLLAKTLADDKVFDFINHLDNPNEFKRPTPIPTLSADHPAYSDTGSYWRGGVWSPTNYMVLNGLTEYGYHQLAYDIADRYLSYVVDTYNKDKTLWENYSPEGLGKGDPAKPNFVGWTGLAPISIFFEYVLGIQVYVPNNRLVWRINKLERHGILQLPFGVSGMIDIVCEERLSLNEKPVISFKSDIDIEVIIHYGEDLNQTVVLSSKK